MTRLIEDTPRDRRVTPDIMMQNFEDIYVDMDAEDYAEMLHEGYRTVLLEATYDDWAGGDHPLSDYFFDRDTEVTIHTNMFNQLTGSDPSGNPVPPIDSINVDLMEKVGTWVQVDPSVEYFGELYPRFLLLPATTC